MVDIRAKRHRSKRVVFVAAAAVASALVPIQVQGQTTYTNGNNTASWSDPLNWNSGEPVAGVDAIFDTPVPAGGSPVTLATGEAANSLTFNDTYTLNGGDLTLTSGNINVATGFVATLNSNLLGTSGLTLNPGPGAAGVLVLGGTNTFTGPVAIQSGTLRFANLAAINESSVTNTIALGTATTVATLDFTGSSATISRAITLGSLGGSPTGNVINVGTAGQTLTLNGRITGGPAAANTALTITGPGVVHFGNNATAAGSENSFTGNIIVDGGSVSVVGLNGANNTAGTAASEGTQFGAGDKTITLTNGGRFINSTTTFNPITNAGHSKGIIIGAGGGTIEANAQISLDDPGQFGGTAAGGSLTKTGTGKLLLSQSNTTYDAAQTFINAGQLELRNANALGDNLPSLTTKSVINLAAGTTLDLRNDSSTNYSYPVVMAANATINVDRTGANSGNTHTLGTLSMGTALTTTGANSFALATGVVTLSANPTFNTTTASLTVASIDAGALSPARTITKTGAQLMTVSGAGTNFSGTTTVNISGGGGIIAGASDAFGPSANITVASGSEYLQSGAASGYGYSVANDSILGGNNAFLSSLNTTGAGTNLNLFPTIIAQTEAGANSSLATRVSFANDAGRIFAIGADLSDSVTVGTGTPWAGIGNDRGVRTLQTGTITANSDFVIRSSGATFVIGNGTTTGGPAIALGSGATSLTATLQGGVIQLAEPTPSYSNAITFAVASGATLQNTQANAFGANTTAGGAGNNASVSVLSGGVMNPNGVAINGNVTIQIGGVLNIDDANNLSGIGSITQFAGSITRIANNGSNALGGAMSAGTVPGSIVRMSTNNIGLLGTTGTHAAANYVVNVAATTVNGVGNLAQLNANAVTLNSAGDVVIDGTTNPIPTGVLTNDGNNRIVTSNSSTVNSVITIGANGGTIAATTATTFTLRGNPTASSNAGIAIAAGANTLNIGAPAGSGLIDGSSKTGNGIVDISGPAGTSIVAGAVNIYSGTLQNLGGNMSYTIGGGTGITRVFSGATFDSRTGTLSNTLLQVDSGGIARFRAGGSNDATAAQQIAGLQGAGSVFLGNTVTGSNRDVNLTVGSNNLSTTFTGVIADSDGSRNGGLTKTGTGTLSLGGANTYTLPTSVNLGELALVGGSLGGTAVTVGSGATPTATSGNAALLIAGNRSIGTATAGSLTISGGNTGGTPIGQGTLSLVDGAPNVLTLTNRTADATTLNIGSNTAGNQALLNLEVGATADRIQLGAGDLINIGSGGSVVNLFGIGGLSGTTPLVLIDAPGGLAVGSSPFSSFTLGTVTGNFNGFNVALDTSSSTQLLLTVSNATTSLSPLYWTGDQGGSWATNNAGNTNWSTDAAGSIDAAAIPTEQSNVLFTADTAANLATTLGADTSINSLTFTGTGTSGTGDVTIGGNTLTLNAAAVNGNTAGTGIVVLANSGAHTISSNVVLGTSQSWTNNSSSLFTVAGNVAAAGNTLTIAGSGNTALSGIVSGSGGLTKIGAGTLTLSAPSTYAGATLVTGGTLAAGVDDALPASTALTLGATGGFSGNLDLGSFNQTIASLRVNSSTTTNTITVASGKSLTVNGNFIVGPVPAATTTMKLTMNGGGTLNAQATGGTFQVGGATGSTAENSTLDLTGLSGVTVDMGLAGVIRVNQPTGTNVAGNQSTLLMPLPAVSAGTPVATMTAGSFNIGDNGSSGGGATQINSVVLGTGLTTLNVNTLAVGSGGRDVGSLTFAAGNGSLKLRGTNGIGAVAVNIGTGGTTTGVAAGMANTVNLNNHDADLLISTLTIGAQNRNTNRTDQLAFNQGTLAATAVVVASISGTANTSAASSTWTSNLNLGGGTVTIDTGGLDIANSTVAVTGTDTLVGNVNISGGAVSVANSAALGAAVRMSNNTQATGITANSNLTITGGSLTLAGDLIKGVITGAGTATVAVQGGTLNLGGNDIGSATNAITLLAASGTLSNVNTINGIGGLTKTTAGTLTITGTGGWTGPTDITGGTLVVSGTLPATSAVTVSAGTLKGAGSIAGPLTLGDGAGQADAIVAPGESVGTLSLGGNLGFAADSRFDLEINSTAGTSDLLASPSGSLTITTGASLSAADLASTAVAAGQAFPFISYNGTLAGTFSSLGLSGLADGTPLLDDTTQFTLGSNEFYLDYNYNGNQVALVAVPEPATAALLAIAGIGLLSRRRRR